MNKFLSRMTMVALLAASCFLVAGCSEGEKPASSGSTEATSSTESGSSTAAEKADGSGTKESSDGSGSK